MATTDGTAETNSTTNGSNEATVTSNETTDVDSAGTADEGTTTTDKVEDKVTVDADNPAVKALIEKRVDEIVKERVARESAKTQKARDELNVVNAISDSRQERLEEATNKLSQLEGENLRLRIAVSEGVSLDVVNALRGDTEEELRKALNLVNQNRNNGAEGLLFKGKDYGASAGNWVADFVNEYNKQHNS